MGFLKGRRGLMIYERWCYVKYHDKECGYKENDVAINKKCCCKDSYGEMTGKNTGKIKGYI